MGIVLRTKNAVIQLIIALSKDDYVSFKRQRGKAVGKITNQTIEMSYLANDY